MKRADQRITYRKENSRRARDCIFRLGNGSRPGDFILRIHVGVIGTQHECTSRSRCDVQFETSDFKVALLDLESRTSEYQLLVVGNLLSVERTVHGN